MNNIFRESKDTAIRMADGMPIKFGQKTVVFIPGIEWNKFYQRPQGLITAMAQLMPDWDFIFCDLGANLPLKRQSNNIYLVSNEWYRQKYDELLEGIFYTTIPRNHEEISKARGKWFDFVDYPNVFYTKSAQTTDKPLNDTNEMLKIADIVTCSSPRLMEDFTKGAKAEVMLLKNAAWAKNTALETFKKPAPIVIGFWGFCGDWVDTELLEYLSDVFPVVVAGHPIDKGNIRNMGLLPHRMLKGMAAICTHLIIPFKKGKTCYYSDPLKYYEYLYANRMIIIPEEIDNRSECDREIEYKYDNPIELVDDIKKTKYWNLDQIPHELHSWENRGARFMQRYVL